jgi:hypothetical protein
MTGDPGLLQEGPDVSALLPLGGDDRGRRLRQRAPWADWTPWLIFRWITAWRNARSVALLVGSMPWIYRYLQRGSFCLSSWLQVLTVLAHGVVSLRLDPRSITRCKASLMCAVQPFMGFPFYAAHGPWLADGPGST